MKYSDNTLLNWCKPASKTEDEKINNSIKMIKDAISKSDELNELDIEVFVQGSYANNTNVRINSDVDVCIMLKSTFFPDYANGMTQEDYGFTDGTITFDDYKSRVLRALQSKFGFDDVKVGNKSFIIASNSYHVSADAVATLMLKDFNAINSRDSLKYIEGTRFFSKDGEKISNYPKEHIRNGIEKNNQTNRFYKRLVRIMKRIRNNMMTDDLINGDIITSFLVECLIWNTPNKIILEYDSWNETIKQAIIYLYNAIKENKHKEWGEVSERLYLFRGRKWTDSDVKDFMVKMWNYLEYDNEGN